MQVIIQAKQMQVTPQLRQRIERKVQRLSRLVDSDARVEVTVSEGQTRSAHDRYSVHMALSGGIQSVFSEVSALNVSAALDLVLDKVVAQLGHHKQRQTSLRRHQAARVLSLARSGRLSVLDGEESSAEKTLEAAVADEHNEEIWSKVMEIRRLPTRAMDDHEVIAEMEKTGAAFYPFFNAEVNGVNVMYRLASGGYGLLVPTVD